MRLRWLRWYTSAASPTSMENATSVDKDVIMIINVEFELLEVLEGTTDVAIYKSDGV